MRAVRHHLPVLDAAPRPAPSFERARAMAERGLARLVRGRVTTLQVNVGKLCNMACHHCHVDAGPRRTEIMSAQVAARVIELVAASPSVEVVDLTGGAPELNPSFRLLVRAIRRLGRRVIDRCNLTVLREPGMEDMAEFLAAEGVQIVASLPCYQPGNVEKQRGRDAFGASIEALRRLNSLGYGRSGSPLGLDLVYNPTGAFLPPPQAPLEARYKQELARLYGIEFHRLLTITNMPVKRFAASLDRAGQQAEYMSLLVNHFNPGTVSALMCRSLVSVSWQGALFDCDFNQMLEIPIAPEVGVGGLTLWDVESVDDFAGRAIATGSHCFGCTAGAGSSCGGALDAGQP